MFIGNSGGSEWKRSVPRFFDHNIVRVGVPAGAAKGHRPLCMHGEPSLDGPAYPFVALSEFNWQV